MAAKKKLKAGDPDRTAKLTKAYQTLKKVRASKTVKLKPSAHLRPTIRNLDGDEVPFRLRYYQVQGAYHMLILKRMVLGDDTGLGKCQPPDTLVLTDKGLRELGSLADWESWAPDTFGPLKESVQVLVGGEALPVKQFYYSGEKPTLKATTRSYFQTEGSEVHPLLVRTAEGEQWVRMSDLTEGDYLCIERCPAPFPDADPALDNTFDRALPSKMSPALARLAGYYIGEGSLNSKYQVVVSQSREVNPEVHADIRRLFKEVLGESPSEGDSIYLSRKTLREAFAANGFGYCTSPGREVPPCILEASRESVREFLRALLEGEGSVVPCGLEYSTASEKLAKQVQVLLLRFGIVARRAPKTVKGRDHTYWRLTIFGQDAWLFQQELGFISSRKTRALETSLVEEGNPNLDVVPHAQSLVENVRSEISKAVTKTGANGDRRGSGLKQFGVSFVNTLNNIRNYGRNPTYPFLETLETILRSVAPDSPYLASLSGLVQRRFFYDPVVKVDGGFAPVMDIEVDHPAHAFIGNGVVSHNTIEAIAAISHLLEKNPEAKVIVVTPKSTVHQWAAEIERFTTGIRPIVVETLKSKKKNGPTPLEHRKALYRDWAETKDKAVLILNYALMIRDWDAEGFVPVKPNGKPDPKQPVVPGVLDQATRDAGDKLITFFDEAQAFSNMRTKTWERARFLSERSDRVYGLTATLLSSKLMEGYCIYKAIKPELFTTKQAFMDNYCNYTLESVPGSNRKLPVIHGYRNLDHFRDRIDPFFLGRKKQEVSDELPVLISKNLDCELGEAETKKYVEALSGVLELGDGEIRDFEEHKALVALLYCQQVADSLALLKYEEGDAVGEDFDYESLDYRDVKVGTLGAKEQAIVDLVSGEGELLGEKVIIYTRFAKFVPRLQKILAKHKVKSVCITGQGGLNKKALDEAGVTGVKAADARKKAQEVFQDKGSDVQVMIITNAGGVGINLQMAKAMVFYNLPWTWGDYVQTLGRMVRIGSPHKGVAVYHLFARLPNTEGSTRTIDHHVYSLLRKKQKLIDQILGEAAAGALDFDKGATGAMDLLRAMVEEAEKKK
jgi:hypothetical protein